MLLVIDTDRGDSLAVTVGPIHADSRSATNHAS